MKKRKMMYLALTIPAIILMLWFIGIPLLNGIRLSFYKWNGYSQKMKFIGIENFIDMIADETVTTDCEELLGWLTEKGHPVLGLEPLM